MKENTIRKSFEDFGKLSPQFTGERYTIGSGIRIAYEHFNRYCFVLNNISADAVVLDLGCGTGYGSILLAQKAKAVYAVDIDQTSLDLLSAICKKHNINNVYPINCEVNEIGSCSALPTGGINTIVCHELIEHINQADQRALMHKISSALGPFSKDCRLFISTPEKEIYNSVNIGHNEFHLQELGEKEFHQLLSSNFKNSKFFWQMPVTGDLILSSDGTETSKSEVSYLNWNGGVGHVGYPSFNLPAGKKGIYMYSISSNSELSIIAKSSLLVDVENRELQERFAIAADELRKLSHLAKNPVTTKIANEKKSVISSQEKLQIASAKKISNLIFESEKIAGQKAQLEEKLVKLEKELARLNPLINPLITGLDRALLERIIETPFVVTEAVSYFDLRHRFAHRLANYVLFKIQRLRPVVAVTKFFKFIRLVLAS